MDEGSLLVEMTGIGKRYGGVQACADIDFTVRRGEVHALMGENGAGKSTLMKILAGDITEYTGSVVVAGNQVHFTGPADAQRAGVALIPQELDLVPALSIAENLFLGAELRTPWRTIDRRKMNAQTAELLRRTGITLNPRQPVGDLRTGEQQLVTIAKALQADASVLIMDEPTSALSQTEVEVLFGVIEGLRAGGVGVVYISHRMDEIGRISDRATVLRNGRVVREFDSRSLNATEAAEAMVGREVQTMFQTDTGSSGDELLRIEELAVLPRGEKLGRREPAGISLTVRRGEIVGLAGLLGAGRTELLEALYGAEPGARWRGEVSFDGRRLRPGSPRRSLREGIAFVPEDRRIAGLALEHSVQANTTLSIVDRIGNAGYVSRAKENSATEDIVERLGVRLNSIRDAVGSLSGGNQQKVVFGRMLLTKPKLLLLDEPTRGVDVGAKAEIYQLLGEIAREGIGVLLASSELAELLGVCDRVVVLAGGRSVTELDTRGLSEADLLAAVIGSRDAAHTDTQDAAAVGAGAEPNIHTGGNR